ncbi:thiamine biosynthesis lipoprotein ApbE [compost metagenome]
MVAGDAARADAWATAMTVLGHGEGLRLAERLSLPVRFLQRQAGAWREHMSPAFEALLETGG